MQTVPTMMKVPGAGAGIQLALWFDPAEMKEDLVLCIHGLTSNLRCWDQIALSLGDRHRFLAMDLRGRGRSDQPPSGYSVAAHVADILAVLDFLRKDRITLMGHSLGAYISLAFAAAFPERMDRLILVDGGGHLPPEQRERVRQALQPALARLGNISPTFEAYVAPLKNTPLFDPWTPTVEDYFRYEILEVEGGVRSRIHPEHIAEESENLTRVDVMTLYPLVSCPTLILRATEGIFVKDDLVLMADAAALMKERISRASQVDLPGTNHYSIVFYPQDARDRAIHEFLTGREE